MRKGYFALIGVASLSFNQIHVKYYTIYNMKNLLLITLLFVSTALHSQIRIVMKGNRIVTSSRVEFTKNTVLMDEYHKINSTIYEMDKSFIISITGTDGKTFNFLSLISSKKDIEDFKNSYDASKPTVIDSVKKEITIKEAKKEISEDSLNLLLKHYIGLPEKDNSIFVEEIITLKDSVKKDKIYLAIMEWISKTFNSSKAVIDFQDKDAGKIICKGYTESPPTKGVLGSDALLIDFSMNFTIKNGKYTIQIYNLAAKEKHYDSMTMSVLQAISTTPNTRVGSRPIDINKINHDYVNNNTESRFREKYAQKVVVRTYIVLKTLTESAQSHIEKTIKGEDKDF